MALELGTKLRSLPLVILNRWTEWPDAAENALYNSSLLASREISNSAGSLRMGLPVTGLERRSSISKVVVPPRALPRYIQHVQRTSWLNNERDVTCRHDEGQ